MTYHKESEIKAGLEDSLVRCPGSYLEKSLRRYGHCEFPESGLESENARRIICSAIDLCESDARPVTKKPLPIQLIRTNYIINNSQSLEAKTNPKIRGGRALDMGIVSPFIFPTMISKANNFDSVTLTAGVSIGILYNLVGYIGISQINPKLIPYAIGTQLITNAISLGYEVVRNRRLKKEQERKQRGKAIRINENNLVMSIQEIPKEVLKGKYFYNKYNNKFSGK